MQPQAVSVWHQEERQRNGEQDPEREATVLGHSFQVRQKKQDQKNGDDDRERQAIRDDHAADVVTLLAEEREPAAWTLRKNLIRPTREHASLLAKGAAQAKRAANGSTK